MENIQEKTLEIINNAIEAAEISVDHSGDDLSQLGMDSITFIRIVVAVEETFGIEVPDEYLLMTEMNTVDKIINVITETLAYERR